MAIAYSVPSSTSSTRIRRPPMLYGGLPVIGHALDLRRDPVGMFQRGRDLFGDVFSIRLPGSTGIALIGTKAQERFFRLSDEDVSQAEAYRLMTPIFGKGMAYDAPPAIMREQLGFFHAALRESRLRTYVEGFVEESENYFSAWKNEGVVDLYNVGNELTIFTSSRSLLGKKFRQQLSGKFAELYHDMEAGLSVVAFFNPYLPLPSFRKRDRARAEMGEMISDIIARRRAEGVQEEDFLQTLMESTYADGRALSEDEMCGLLLAIMFAGHHTSGVTFSWTGVQLAKHPEWVQRLREEQERVLGDRTELTIDDLRSMVLLEATIKEVLRMYPPIIMMMRKVINGFEYGGYSILPGDTVFSVPAVAHYLPEVFEDPQRFDPNRFMPERAEDKKNPMGWIAFGAGRHRCMGIVFAQLQLRAIWSHLLRNFDFELMDVAYEPDYSRLLVGPRQPCTLRYRRRTNGVVVPTSNSV